jgi:propionate CoA-transferase
MEFKPAISPQLKTMDAALFHSTPLGLRDRLLAKPLPERLHLDAQQHMLFIDFEGLAVDTAEDIEDIEQAVRDLLEPVVKSPEDKVAVVVNYDNFSIVPGLVDRYSAMVERLTARFYTAVTRYGTVGFLKAKLES